MDTEAINYRRWLGYDPSDRKHARELIDYLRRTRESLPSGPATGTKTFGTEREHINLLVSILLVVGHVLWLSTDDTSKRFALLELT